MIILAQALAEELVVVAVKVDVQHVALNVEETQQALLAECLTLDVEALVLEHALVVKVNA